MYRVYYMMRHRCMNPKSRVYKYYGGKGITLCPEWQTFVPFRDWARANGYRKGLSIDRYPNPAGNYEPTNCRWATRLEQRHNR